MDMTAWICVGSIIAALIFSLIYQYVKSEKDWRDDWK